MKKRKNIKVIGIIIFLIVISGCAVKFCSDQYKLKVLQKKREEVKKYTNLISVEGDHILRLKEDGTVEALGNNEEGQCNVQEWSDIISISTGYLISAGLKKDGTVVATGLNDQGQCEVGEWKNIIAISASVSHVLGLQKDGTVVSTGRIGEYEYDVPEVHEFQEQVEEWKNIILIQANEHGSVGMDQKGKVYGVFYNQYEGDGNIYENGLKYKKPLIYQDYSEWSDIVDISIGYYQNIGLKSDGMAVSRGGAAYLYSNVSDWKDIIQISAGYNHTVGLKSDGTVVAVGANDKNQCDVSEWKDIVAVDSGFYYTVGIKKDGTIVTAGQGCFDEEIDLSDWDLF